jgi:uncharacterized protein
MQQDLMRYDLLVQDALKGVVKKVLTSTLHDGLLGEHHFYISFRTDYPGAKVSSRLREKYPQEMTIVLQHQFWDLAVHDSSFEVGLSFSGVPEKLLVPFDGLTGFFDPSVQFGLKFEVKPVEAEEDALEVAPKSAGRKASVKALKEGKTKEPTKVGKISPVKPAPSAKPASQENENTAEVVSLDAFRKKT